MTDFRLPPLNLGERFYRALIWLYPPRFRRAFGLDLLEAFRDERRESSNKALFWLSILQDVFTHSAAEWASTIGRGPSPGYSRPMWNALRPGELRFAVRRLRRAP